MISSLLLVAVVGFLCYLFVYEILQSIQADEQLLKSMYEFAGQTYNFEFDFNPIYFVVFISIACLYGILCLWRFSSEKSPIIHGLFAIFFIIGACVSVYAYGDIFKLILFVGAVSYKNIIKTILLCYILIIAFSCWNLITSYNKSLSN